MTADEAYAVPCPHCGAKAGKRCGWWQEPPNNSGYRQRRVWKHRPGLVHVERAARALARQPADV